MSLGFRLAFSVHSCAREEPLSPGERSLRGLERVVSPLRCSEHRGPVPTPTLLCTDSAGGSWLFALVGECGIYMATAPGCGHTDPRGDHYTLYF